MSSCGVLTGFLAIIGGIWLGFLGLIDQNNLNSGSNFYDYFGLLFCGQTDR